MKLFFNVLLSLLLIALISVLIVALIGAINGFTIVEQLRQWFGYIFENPPIVDPTKKVSL